jgi:hypothetical protein
MRKALIAGVCLVVAAAAAYLGVSHFIGGMVSTQVALYERRLLEIDGVSVTRFAYDKRLFDGELIYDIAWRPSREHPLRAAFDEIAKKEDLKEIRLAGRIPVRHGPWVGKFAAARIDFKKSLPDEERKYFPKYPGQAPWLTVDAIVEWTGEVGAAFRFVDYDGRIGDLDDPDEPVAAVEGHRGFVWVAGDATRATLETTFSRLQAGALPGFGEIRDAKLKGTIDIANGQRLTGALEIGTLRVEAKTPAPGTVMAGPYRLTFDAKQEWPFIWTGDFVSELRGLTFNLSDLRADKLQELRATLAAFDLRSTTTRKGEKIDTTTAFTIGPATIADIALPALALDVSLRDLDGEAFNAWIGTLDSVVATLGKPDPAAIERLTQLSARLVAAGPQFAVDRLSLSVRSPDDLKLTLQARPAAGVVLPKDRFAPLFEWLEARVAFTASLEAMEALLVAAARLETAFDKNRSFGAAEERTARERFARAKAVLAQTPLVAIEGDILRVEADLTRGRFGLNGRPGDLLQTFALGAMAADALKQAMWPTAAARREVPDPQGVPTARRAFTPANLLAGPPFLQLVQAGGDDLMDGRLGPDCTGHIDAARPTLSVDYVAGGEEVFIHASTSSGADIGLIVRTPGGAWLCNDDAPGHDFDPLVRIARPAPGRYLVWVATIEPARAEALVRITPTEPARRR